MFPEVEVYRYVTEQTFDAYLYQLVESKQKFISQIMTSKSPVRSAEDVDEVALSFAEVKILATGDARFKEKMDLDIQVSKLRVLKQSYLSEHYDLEDRVLKYYPQTIKEYEERIAGYENDAALAEQHQPQGADAAAARQQLVQKMLRRFAARVQPEKQRRALRQLRGGRPASVRRFGLKIGQREIHGQLGKRDGLPLQADRGHLPRVQSKLEARHAQVAAWQTAAR